MCGIGGIAGAPPDPRLLERIAETMRNRGPDGEGLWTGNDVGLAFRRLRIIDLHERSNQPMHLEGLHLVFNGEIYNYLELREQLDRLGHRFRTEGDAEVLLHAWVEWGEQSLERLNGMFAFAVWDEGARSLTLASDPFGEKPLYWSEAGGRIAFASEIKALLQVDWVDAQPDLELLGNYVARESVMPHPWQSFFREVHRLPAAHLLRWRDGRTETARYWSPEPVATPDSYEDSVAELRALLVDSIRLRLRSDVPVGTSLSGGVDSSAIVALSAKLAGDHRRHAFTASFPGFARDEWSYAEQVARSAGVVEHHAVEPSGDELLADLEALVDCQEEPVGNSSIYAQWRVMKRAKECGVTVLLDGQGGDELLGGYKGTSGWALRSQGPAVALRAIAADRSELGAVTRSLASDRLPRFAVRAYRRRLASPYAVAELVRAASRFEPAVDIGRDGGPLGRQLRLELFETSLPPLLRYADRNSMAHSREVRLPLLDRRVAEFALSLPPEFVYRDRISKSPLRDAVRELVPAPVLNRQDKIGFLTPHAQWLSEPRARESIAELLLSPAARGRGLYATDAVEDDWRSGRWRDPAGIWRATFAELWLRRLSAWRSAGTNDRPPRADRTPKAAAPTPRSS
jgi:asparagine synthase (glutamine-hydrolysing)